MKHIFYWITLAAVILAITSRMTGLAVSQIDPNFAVQGLRPLFWILNLDHHLPKFPKVNHEGDLNQIYCIWNTVILVVVFVVSWIIAILPIGYLLYFLKPKQSTKPKPKPKPKQTKEQREQERELEDLYRQLWNLRRQLWGLPPIKSWEDPPPIKNWQYPIKNWQAPKNWKNLPATINSDNDNSDNEHPPENADQTPPAVGGRGRISKLKDLILITMEPNNRTFHSQRCWNFLRNNT